MHTAVAAAGRPATDAAAHLAARAKIALLSAGSEVRAVLIGAGSGPDPQIMQGVVSGATVRGVASVARRAEIDALIGSRLSLDASCDGEQVWEDGEEGILGLCATDDDLRETLLRLVADHPLDRLSELDGALGTPE